MKEDSVFVEPEKWMTFDKETKNNIDS